MPQIESILCPIDFSDCSVNAYEYALSLAWHYKAKLFLQHVLYPLSGSFATYGGETASYERVCQRLRADTEEKLQQFARRHPPTRIRPQCIVQDGSATDLILCLAKKRAVDLIVMGTHGLRGIDRLMVGSVTERVLRRAPCPVLAVRKPAHLTSSLHDPEPIHLKRMLLCVDFSDHAHRASEYAVSMAKEYGAELILLHVLEDVPKSTDLEIATEQVAKRLEESIAPPSTRGGCKVKVMVRIGKPYQQIIQLALETQTDLVIMGVRGRGAVDTAIFGSTTHRVLQLGSCPVLAVHI